MVTDFLLGRTETLAAVSEELASHEHEHLHAPDLVEPETLNALRRLAARGSVSQRRATEASSDLAQLRLIRYPHAPLRARVWDLRHDLTAYDASYLALAEALGDATLMTGDRGMVATARRSLGDSKVRYVQ